MASKNVLEGILTVLISEWGYDQVMSAVSRIEKTKSRKPSGHQTVSKYKYENVKKPSPTAVEQVDAIDRSSSHRNVLYEIAERFDRKEFLPTAPDIREFMLMTGQQPTSTRDRSEAFKRLLKFFQGISLEQLYQVSSFPRIPGQADSELFQTQFPAQQMRWPGGAVRNE